VRLSAAGRTALTEGGRPASRSDARLLALLTPKKRDAFVKTLADLASAADATEAPPKPSKKKAQKAKGEAKAPKSAGKKKGKAKKPPKAAT
jgi:hypothetical protein